MGGTEARWVGRDLGRVERAFGILIGSPFLGMGWVRECIFGDLGVGLVRDGLMSFVLTELSISFLLRVLE